MKLLVSFNNSNQRNLHILMVSSPSDSQHTGRSSTTHCTLDKLVPFSFHSNFVHSLFTCCFSWCPAPDLPGGAGPPRAVKAEAPGEGHPPTTRPRGSCLQPGGRAAQTETRREERRESRTPEAAPEPSQGGGAAWRQRGPGGRDAGDGGFPGDPSRDADGGPRPPPEALPEDSPRCSRGCAT